MMTKPLVRVALLLVALPALTGCGRIDRLINGKAEPTTYPLEFDERCAEQARKRVSDILYDDARRKTTLSVENNYSRRFQRCFVRIEGIWPGGTFRVFILDAVRGREYGSFQLDEPGSFLNHCVFTLPDGTQQQCKDSNDFDGKMSLYMGDLRLDGPPQ